MSECSEQPCRPSAPSGLFASGQRVLPVLTIETLDCAVPIVAVLADAGLTTIEITLRTRVALGAIARVASELPHVTIGAGTVLNPEDLSAALDAGADFAVSPGASEALYRAARRERATWVPGVASASDIMRGLDAGLNLFKFFPAAALGGPAAVALWAGPLSSARFCPTGGIDSASAMDYLRLNNVVAVGGSWMIPADAVRKRDWVALFTAARQAAQLGSC